jgi:hypothetical protein
MSTITLIKPPTPSAVRDLPSFGEMLEELLPVVGVVVVAGPPVVFLFGPWLFLVLMLVGPFVLAVTVVLVIVVALVAAAALVALTGAIAATPYLVVRRLAGHRRGHAYSGAPAGRLVALESRHGAA